jgi:hypothetical protein
MEQTESKNLNPAEAGRPEGVCKEMISMYNEKSMNDYPQTVITREVSEITSGIEAMK